MCATEFDKIMYIKDNERRKAVNGPVTTQL